MPKDVQLQQVVVNGMVVKMRGDNIGRHIVGRMLDGRKGMDFLANRQHDNAARMLAGRPPYAHAALDDAPNLAVALAHAPFLIVILDIAKGRLIGQCANRPRAVGLPIAKNHLAVSMRLALVLAGEIQVNIRLLIAFKAEEGLKGDVKPFLAQGFPALGAFSVGHVAACPPRIGLDLRRIKVAVMAAGAVIVGRQRVYLRNPRHSGHKGRAHRSPGTHQIAVLIGLPHQLLGNDVHHRVPIRNNGIQLPLQPLLDNGGKILPVDFMRLVVADIPQQLIGIVDNGRAFVRAHGGNLLTHVGNLIRVLHHHFLGLLAAQVGKFFQHLLRSAQIQGRLVIRILKTLARHNNPAVHLVLRIQEMHVTGGYHWLVKVFAQPDNPPVKFLQLFF